MKQLFALLFALLTSTLAQSQTASVFIDTVISGTYTGQVSQANFSTHDFSGEVVELSHVGTGELIVELTIFNLTGTPQDWLISRRRIGVDASWSDFLVYGPTNDPFGGVGIDVMTMDIDLYTPPINSSTVYTLGDMETMLVAPHIIPVASPVGCGVYRYYVGTELDPFLDSVDIEICHILGVEEISSNSDIQIYPNPVSDKLQIKADVQDASLSIIDAVGREVLSDSFTNQAVIDVSKFKNGIYFITLKKDGLAAVEKKIIIQH